MAAVPLPKNRRRPCLQDSWHTDVSSLCRVLIVCPSTPDFSGFKKVHVNPRDSRDSTESVFVVKKAKSLRKPPSLTPGEAEEVRSRTAPQSP